MTGLADRNAIVRMRPAAGCVRNHVVDMKARLQIAAAMLAGVVLACRDLGAVGRAE
jgi:hypothetical protein